MGGGELTPVMGGTVAIDDGGDSMSVEWDDSDSEIVWDDDGNLPSLREKATQIERQKKFERHEYNKPHSKIAKSVARPEKRMNTAKKIIIVGFCAFLAIQGLMWYFAPHEEIGEAWDIKSYIAHDDGSCTFILLDHDGQTRFTKSVMEIRSIEPYQCHGPILGIMHKLYGPIHSESWYVIYLPFGCEIETINWTALD